MIKYIFLAAGSLTFFIGTKFLISAAREQNLVKSFVRSIDTDGNGIINPKEIKAFQPCPQFDGKVLARQFRDAGKRVNINDLANELSSQKILKAIKVCEGNYNQLRDIEHIKSLKASVLAEEFFNTYDISNNNEVKWSEYHVVNMAQKGINENTRKIFQFVDKNRDWKITRKEAEKVKPKKIEEFMDKKRKRGGKH